MSIKLAKNLINRRRVPLKRKALAISVAVIIHLLLFIFVAPPTIKVRNDPPETLPPWVKIGPPTRPLKPERISGKKDIIKRQGDHVVPEAVEFPENTLDDKQLEEVYEGLEGTISENSFSSSDFAGRVVEISAPSMIYKALPSYPSIDKDMGTEGRVKLRLELDKKGNVVKVMLENSSGHDSLDKAAMNAASLCEYTPAFQNGKPIRVQVFLTYIFSLDSTVTQE